MQISTKRDYVYEQIKNDILSGKLKPDTKLVISDLAKKYKMSHIPIREALAQLNNEGLIQNVPFTGFRVVGQELDKIIELNVLRTEMECLALRVSHPFITDADIEISRELLKKLHTLYEEGNLREYIVTNRAFYVSLFSYGPYKHLQSEVKEFFHQSRISSSIIAPHHIPESLKGHADLLQALESRDTEKAVRLYRREKNRSFTAMLDVMREVILEPSKLHNNPVSAFFTEESIRENKVALLAQLDWLKKLIYSTET